MPTPTVLFYSPTPAAWAPNQRHTCAIQKLPLQHIYDSHQGCTHSALLTEKSPPEGAVSPLPEPILVLCGLNNAQLDKLLPALRKLGAGPCLKAVLTPTNASWTLSALYEELCKERAEIQGPQ